MTVGRTSPQKLPLTCPTTRSSHMLPSKSGIWGESVMGRSRRGLGVVVVLGVVASLGLVPVGSASAAVAGDVVISEFMFDPRAGVDGDEFLELTNRTASPVDLSGWSCTKGI